VRAAILCTSLNMTRVVLLAVIGLAVPGRPIGPWSRRTGAPEASATRRDRNPSPLTACSRDLATPAATARDSYPWGRGEGPRRRACSAPDGHPGTAIQRLITRRGNRQPRRLRGSPTKRWSRRLGLTQQYNESRSSHVRAPSFSPAVPPTCHKQRSRAVSSGQPRSLEAGRLAGAPVPDLRWGRSPKLHGMQGLR
jgi:hypothetical protein